MISLMLDAKVYIFLEYELNQGQNATDLLVSI